MAIVTFEIYIVLRRKDVWGHTRDSQSKVRLSPGEKKPSVWPPGSLWPPSSSMTSSALPSGLFHLVNYLQSQQASQACFIGEDWLGRAVIILQSAGEMKAGLGKDGVIRDSEQQDCITAALKWAAAALPSLESDTENGSPVLDAELAQAGIIISHSASQSRRKHVRCPSFCSPFNSI